MITATSLETPSVSRSDHCNIVGNDFGMQKRRVRVLGNDFGAQN